MKKFFAALLLVGVLGFVGCGEKTTEEKAKDAMDGAKKDAKEMMDDAKKKVDGE